MSIHYLLFLLLWRSTSGLAQESAEVFFENFPTSEDQDSVPGIDLPETSLPKDSAPEIDVPEPLMSEDPAPEVDIPPPLLPNHPDMSTKIPESDGDPAPNVLGGVYSGNATLYFRNSPYRVQSDLTVETGATLTIETGVKIYFDTGVGLKIKGTINAVGNEFAHIQMLPYQQMLNYDDSMPVFRLADGPSVRQGRLQVKFRDRWRSVCTQLTNWTSVDTGTACKSMGYEDGGFWKWYRRNNDTYPFVMPRPRCIASAKSLWDCSGFEDEDKIPLSENLCHGEDDIGLVCWETPTFTGWAKHWKGLQILSSPFKFVPSDPDMVSVHRQSISRLEYVDILYAGYNAETKNATAALWIEGVPPILNGMRVERSARDGIYFYEPSGPIIVANSTIVNNRGHGIAVENTTDGRVFINMTLVQGNWGDGIRYREKAGGIQLVHKFIDRGRRQSMYYEEERPRVEMCNEHSIPESSYFPHLISAFLPNGTAIDPQAPSPCWTVVSLPPRLAYTYTLQFVSMQNRNLDESRSELLVCDTNANSNKCAYERYRIPLLDGILPQSISLRSVGRPVFITLEHIPVGLSGRVAGDVSVQFRVHASVKDRAFYGLNVTNSLIFNNTGNGIVAQDIRERTCLSNVSVISNEGHAGVLVQDGAADIWINATNIEENWGDGLNVSYAGGSITINGTSISRNRWRGCAFHHNTSTPFLALHQEIVFKGRPSNNMFYLRTVLSENGWGGILVGNFCIPVSANIIPRVIVSWTELTGNRYHPSIEVHSCQRHGVTKMHVDITGNRVERGHGIGFRLEPAVNVIAVISSNRFLNNNNTALLIRNAIHPQLAHLPAQVTISKNSFKFNTGQCIVSIGLNEDAPNQKLIFNQQNEVRENTVINPFPYLNPRSHPYAALLVSSSNVEIRRNCFKNPRASYEIATELSEHAKWIDARENNWGHPFPDSFLHRIFDQFNRYSLAYIEVNPFAAVCNQRNPHITTVQQYYRSFRKESQPFILGGTIWENEDLAAGRYIITDDLNVEPGARLTISPGTVFEFSNGVGMLVQGEMVRADFQENTQPVTFTSRPFKLPQLNQIRLVDENDNFEVTSGRLEVFIDGQWGTVCNRSWTPQLARLTCNQLGLIMDEEYFENWRIFPSPGELPIMVDNIRCEEREYDLTRCRHDGVEHNVVSSCRPTEVVGLRCTEPRWAGVRYSLLANPPTITGQTSMDKWVIEKAGLFDFTISQFSAALQIDWNYHTFKQLTIRDNFWNGVDVVYNDLTKKPAIRNSRFENNRRHGFKLRSPGITIEEVVVTGNGNAGLRYNPQVSVSTQRDIVTWLERREQSEMEANNVYVIPNHNITVLNLQESQLNQRKFIMARATADCPLALLDRCVYDLSLKATGFEYGLSARIAVQIVNRAGSRSDEDIVVMDENESKEWSVRKNAIQFPIVSSSSDLKLRYTRTHGNPEVVLLVLFLDAREYLDRFVHLYRSEVSNNQYGLSSVHYSDLNLADGTILNRWSEEKLWLQKVNLTRNTEAVIWVHSPQHVFEDGTPIAQIGYHIDNCSVVNNTGGVIETHRDLYTSANVFRWNFWSNTFAYNDNMFISVHLPDTYNLISPITHSFLMTENRFELNNNFGVRLDGYYTFANISSNNFTSNNAYQRSGIVELHGMEKHLIFERNRMFDNWGLWVLKLDIQSQSLRGSVPAFIQFNYFLRNRFISSTGDYVDSWPRSYAVAVFGAQLAQIHFNRFKNVLVDFELVSGCKSADVTAAMNVTHNWWGVGNEAQISQRIFDFDDWNIYTLADFSPYYVTEEKFIHFWWKPMKGQLAVAVHNEPSIYDLRGRMYESKTLTLNREKWHEFPFYYKPRRPYRIIKDLTIMPNATLTIEKGVEVHIWPNVRILVLGHLIADGTFWEPIRFKPINMTEYKELRGQSLTRYKKSSVGKRFTVRERNRMMRYSREIRTRRRAQWIGNDDVYRQFPLLHRQHPYYQQFKVRLNGTNSRWGFLEMHNSTTGEYVPSCDREFTLRNAQVVCRELGYSPLNVYHWLTPRWAYNPLVNILKTYVEPRECIGNELSLDKCPLRMNGNISMWQCIDNEHFNFIHCGDERTLNSDYLGNWGGIAFSHSSLEHKQSDGEETSILRHIEIVGGGLSHNDTTDVGALLFVHRFPILENVNITNSSMDALQVINPQNKLMLSRLNITQNRGRGVSIWVANLQGAGAGTDSTRGKITIPYNIRGMLDICSSRKEFTVKSRIFLYHKYDSYPVDCVKHFTAGGKSLAFRFLLVNFYNGSRVDLGRSDSLSIYSDPEFKQLIHRFSPLSEDISEPIQSNDHFAMHMRASAADGVYGFIAEIVTLPSLPQSNPVDEILVHQSRIEQNDRGAVMYRNTGEMGPQLTIDYCSITHNGYHLDGNITTSLHAVQLHLHNTMWAQVRGTSIVGNTGGLLITSDTSSSVARLTLIIRDSAISHNSNNTAIALLGNNYQKASLLNNLISQNYAIYYDTVLVRGFSTNFTHNLLVNNTGLHTVDVRAYSTLSTESHAFHNNWFHDNLALGHGHQYMEDYGFQPETMQEEVFARRPKRQALNQTGVSFDWWTHVGRDTERYRSTVFAGVSRGVFHRNAFNNPLNPYELTTAPVTNFDTGVIDASDNYWGYPGTVGVASGKIRDGADYDYLIRVNYQPVLESNTSLIDGDCPAGWFSAGFNEFKSCFLFVGAAATYSSAVHFCEQMDAFVPFLRADDARQDELAQKVEAIASRVTTDSDRFGSFPDNVDHHFWISSVSVPVTKCGWMSSRTATIGTQNCNNLLPFVCERGIKPYEDPPLWRSGMIIAASLIGTLLGLLVLLALCWCHKSRKRKEEDANRKEFFRASLRLSKLEKQRLNNQRWSRAQASGQDSSNDREDMIARAHRNMIHGADRSLPDMSPRVSLMAKTNDPESMVRTTPCSPQRCPQSVRTSDDGSPTCSMSSTCFTSATDSTAPPRQPNAYKAPAVVSTFNSAKRDQEQIRMRENEARWNSCSSTCSTASMTECSTCPTEDSGSYSESSTLTDGSEWNDSGSTLSSTVSEHTIVARPLLMPDGLDSIDTHPVALEEARSRRPLSTGFADHFIAPQRVAPPPPTTPLITAETVFPVNPLLAQPTFEPSVEKSALIQLSPKGTPPKTPTNPTSASYRSRLRPGVAPPGPPKGHYERNGQPSSRSLVDLVSPDAQMSPRRNSTGRWVMPIETSM